MSTDEMAVREEGITVLSSTTEGSEPIADLVFIHGLQGHPEKTWKYSKKSGFKSELISVYWPRALLGIDFPNVRVLTYGYDSHVSKFFAATSQSGIFAHGQKFLRALKRVRQEAPKRPLIFLAHSLGGIITKDTLRQAQESQDETENAILSSTHAVIFFGTPHRGSDYASIAQVVERATSILFSTNSKLLGNLIPDGEILERIRLDFNRMLDGGKFKIFSFQEAKGLSGFSFLSKKVVQNFSSSLDHAQELREEINANHRMMCRFHGATDEGYMQVKGVVSEYLNEIIQQAITRQHEKLWKDCLQSIYSPAMNQRRDNIERPETHTFEWIFRENSTGYIEWLAGDGSLLWIKGKPAAGKSTLLKYLHEHETTMEVLMSRWKVNATVVSFFFYDQASSTQWRSFDGLLRSLLYALLDAVPQLFAYIVEIYKDAASMGDPSWKRADLEKAIIAIGKQEDITGCIVLFMDALDEYPGDCKEIIRNMSRLLEWFARGAYKLKICASSRPLNEFEAMLPLFPGFAQIAIHDWTLNDIKIIVSKMIKEANRGEMPELCKEIVSMAKGSFVWVNLALKALSPPLFHFESEEQLLDHLYDLPGELDGFYDHLLQIIPKEIHFRIRTILQLMFCTANRLHGLTLAEFGVAVGLRENGIVFDEKLPFSPSDDLRRCRELKISIDTCLGAFLELDLAKYSTDPRATCPPTWTFSPLTISEYEFTMSSLIFSHKTAKDFILSRIKSNFFQPGMTMDNILAGHIRLCRVYTQLVRNKHGLYYLIGATGWTSDATSFNHFDTDIVVHWAIHTREVEHLQYAAISGEVPVCHDTRDSATLLDNNVYMGWPRPPYRRAVEVLGLTHVFDPVRKRRVDDFYDAIFASMGPNWLQQWAEQFRDWNFDEEMPVPKTLLGFALLNGLFLYARDFIESDPAYQVDRHDTPLLFWTIASCKFISATTVLDMWRDEAERAHMFAYYLLKNGANPNAVFTIPYLQKPWDELAERPPFKPGHAKITALHFALGVIVSIIDGFTSQLRMAMLEFICILVENGATTGNTLYANYWRQRLEEPPQRTILHYLTFEKAYEDVYQGSNNEKIDRFDFPDEGPLLRRTIKTLLDHGADPNARDSQGMDVLTAFMLSCPRDIVEYALEKGALISPLLLRDDGSPVRKYGILLEDRWKRPECYTPEARELVRKHMPHWKDVLDGRPLDERPGGDVVEGMGE